MWLGPPEISQVLTIPFFKNVVFELGPFFVLVGIIVIAGPGRHATVLGDGIGGTRLAA